MLQVPTGTHGHSFWMNNPGMERELDAAWPADLGQAEDVLPRAEVAVAAVEVAADEAALRLLLELSVGLHHAP